MIKEQGNKYVKILEGVFYKKSLANKGLTNKEETEKQVYVDLIILKQTIEKDFKIRWFEEKE